MAHLHQEHHGKAPIRYKNVGLTVSETDPVTRKVTRKHIPDVVARFEIDGVPYEIDPGSEVDIPYTYGSRRVAPNDKVLDPIIQGLAPMLKPSDGKPAPLAPPVPPVATQNTKQIYIERGLAPGVAELKARQAAKKAAAADDEGEGK